MGHVDHGKSTLLDFIRKSNTVEKEAGGITQHVAAYEVEREKNDTKKRITFIDTPGHAAFQSIRARGANVADIAILVVAADDGVKAQTLEALASIRAAKIPFIVAINKIDKANANIERTQATLMEKEVFLEKLGGDVPWAAISAKTGAGVDELLDLILLVAEVHEYKGDASLPAEGYVLESSRDPKRGLAATLVITNGSLKGGMTILAGRALSPVRIMETPAGKSLKQATFSTPVRLVGFDEMPIAGSPFVSFGKKRDAEDARSKLGPAERQQTAAAASEETEHFAMPLIVRADTMGSLEAIAHEMARLADERSSVRIVQSGVGAISEGDVKAALAGVVPAVVVGFNVDIDSIAEEYARQHSVRIEVFSIIYKMTERIEELLGETRPKRAVDEIVGKAKVLKQFSSRKDSHVIGGSVSSGYIARGAHVRIHRRNVVIGVGKVKNIQTNKQDVDRVPEGSEFGAQIESDFEVAQGDVLECFTTSMK
jgi:translation initiation factor IF-2